MPLRLLLSALLIAALACTGGQAPPEPPPLEPVSHDVPPPPPPPPPPEPPPPADTGAPLPTPGAPDGEDAAAPEPEPEPAPEPTVEDDQPVKLRITHRVPVDQKATLDQKAERRLRMRAKAMGYSGVEDVRISNRRCTPRYCTVTASGVASTE